jgi:ketosteroid isomerase-like protein
MRKLYVLSLLLVFFTATSTAQSQDYTTINEKIIKYVDDNMEKKISRGECWDLVAGALNETGAKWESPTGFGKKSTYKLVKAGDVIVFDKTTFKGEGYMQSFWQHYAIVYKKHPDGSLEIAHQNYNNKKEVHIITINPREMTKGTLTYYRPVVE